MILSWLHEERMSQPAPSIIPWQAAGGSSCPTAPGSSCAGRAPCLQLIQKQSSFSILYFHSTGRGLPTARVLFTCQKRSVPAKLPTMSFIISACQWCLGHSRRGSTAKPLQLLQWDSLASFSISPPAGHPAAPQPCGNLARRCE